ncbi:MAG: hypothetical protein IPN80_07000 [Flavobacterium sp.]|nr:hypothetical protein [Flavobacterium sp.]MBL0014266.1 hypothetical protein [Flavobacterium sp.]
MKTFKSISKLVLIAFTIVLSSCSKDNDSSSSTPITPSGSYITATVDGASFSTSIAGISTASGSRSGSGEFTLIQVVGADINSNSIAINLLGITTTGTYTLNADSDSVLAYTPPTGGLSYSTGGCSDVSGTMNVTFIDNTKIEGTFSFTGKDVDNCATSATKTVTNGSFRCVFVN